MPKNDTLFIIQVTPSSLLLVGGLCNAVMSPTRMVQMVFTSAGPLGICADWRYCCSPIEPRRGQCGNLHSGGTHLVPGSGIFKFCVICGLLSLFPVPILHPIISFLCGVPWCCLSCLCVLPSFSFPLSHPCWCQMVSLQRWMADVECVFSTESIREIASLTMRLRCEMRMMHPLDVLSRLPAEGANNSGLMDGQASKASVQV